MEMNGQPGGEDRQVKINTGETGQTEGDAEEVEFFHVRKIIGAGECHADVRM